MRRFHDHHGSSPGQRHRAADLLPGHGPLTRPVVDEEVAESVRARTVRDRVRGVPHRAKLGDRHLRRRLIRLVQAAERVVPVRPAGHLDMAAEHVGNRMGARELGHPVQARGERGHVADVEAPRVDGVTGQQEPGRRVVHGDRRVMVPGRAGHAQPPAAQVERDHLLRPAREAEELPDRRHGMGDDRCPRPLRELAVARHVVAVPVRVRDDELVPGPAFAFAQQAVDRLSHAAVGDSAGVKQHCPVLAAQAGTGTAPRS